MKKYVILSTELLKNEILSDSLSNSFSQVRLNNDSSKMIVKFSGDVPELLKQFKIYSKEEISDIISDSDWQDYDTDLSKNYDQDERDAFDSAASSEEAKDSLDISQLIEFDKKTSTQGIPKVAIHKSEGTDFSRASHDWTDPTTWYHDSTRVTGETPTLDTGTTYDLANSNIIDLVNGKVSDEDDFSDTYKVVLYDGGTEISTDDYTVNYAAGSVTLDSAPGGALTADYSYENGSTYCLAPDAGKVLFLEHAEIQFCGLTTLKPIEFQIWAYNPYDLPNKVMVKKKIYKNAKDILNSANLGTGVVKAFGELTNDISVFPFNYVYLQPLKSSQGLEMRIKIPDDVAMTGEYSTVTFYCISEDE